MVTETAGGFIREFTYCRCHVRDFNLSPVLVEFKTAMTVSFLFLTHLMSHSLRYSTVCNVCRSFIDQACIMLVHKHSKHGMED